MPCVTPSRHRLTTVGAAGTFEVKMALLLILALATPLQGRIVYVCRGSSDALRSQWSVWDAVVDRRCEVQRW